jgi:hypothetical protein
MPFIDFDFDDDPAAIRQAYLDTYRQQFGAWDVPDSAILARFAAENERPTARDVANLCETVAVLERILDGAGGRRSDNT